MKREELILVNEDDEAIGVEEKITAHLNGALHRAFSLFIFNSDGQLLVQKRTSTKYHSKSLWSNTCCGHPRPGESIEAASRRRLSEEMGFDCGVEKVFEFVYRVKLDNGFYEHEYDHVLVGKFDGTPAPNHNEVDDWDWANLKKIRLDMQAHPDNYTYWFRISIDELCRSVKSSKSLGIYDLLSHDCDNVPS
jgi:isopentenyl-diphosphate delta-isomerase